MDKANKYECQNLTQCHENNILLILTNEPEECGRVLKRTCRALTVKGFELRT